MKPNFSLIVLIISLTALLFFIYFYNSKPEFKFYVIYLSEIVPASLNQVPYGVYIWYTDFRHRYNCELPECFAKVERCKSMHGSDTYIYKVARRSLMDGWSMEYFDKNGKSLCFLYSGLCIQDGCDERYKQCPKTSSCNLILGNNFKLPFESK